MKCQSCSSKKQNKNKTRKSSQNVVCWFLRSTLSVNIVYNKCDATGENGPLPQIPGHDLIMAFIVHSTAQSLDTEYWYRQSDPD